MRGAIGGDPVGGAVLEPVTVLRLVLALLGATLPGNVDVVRGFRGAR